MLCLKQGPVIPKWINQAKLTFGNYFGTEGLVSLFVMIFIGYKSEMGLEKYAWKKEGRLCYPASIDIPRHNIQEQGSMSYFITTRYQSTTVINYTHMQCSDVNLFWKIQYPTKNDIIYDTFEWHCSSATTKKRFNVDDSTTDPSSRSVKTISKPDPVFEHLEHNLLSMTAQQASTVTNVIFAPDHKAPKAQAGLAPTRQGKGKKVFPESYVSRNDSTEPESSDQDNITPYATSARELQLSWTLYGSMPRRAFINQDGIAHSWDIGRLGYFNPQPSNFESQGKYWKPTLDHMSGLDDDRLFTAFSKTSMTNTTRRLASAKQGKGKKKQQAAISFPRNHVTQFDSAESESSDCHTAQHATLTSELTRKSLALTLEQTNGAMPRRVFINRNGKTRNWDIDRLGFYNLRPFVYESPADYWHPTHDRMNAVDDDRSSTTSPKPSMVSTKEQVRREHMEYEKSIDLALDLDFAKTAAVYPSGDRTDLVQDQEGIENITNAVPGSSRISHRRTRRDTRLASYVYPTPVYGTDDEDGTGSGPPPDPKHVPRLDDDDDVSRPNQRSATSKAPSVPLRLQDPARLAHPRIVQGRRVSVAFGAGRWTRPRITTLGRHSLRPGCRCSIKLSLPSQMRPHRRARFRTSPTRICESRTFLFPAGHSQQEGVPRCTCSTTASTSPPGGVIGRAAADGRSPFRCLPAWVG